MPKKNEPEIPEEIPTRQPQPDLPPEYIPDEPALPKPEESPEIIPEEEPPITPPQELPVPGKDT